MSTTLRWCSIVSVVSLGLQVPAEKVFGVGQEGLSTLGGTTGGVWFGDVGRHFWGTERPPPDVKQRES